MPSKDLATEGKAGGLWVDPSETGTRSWTKYPDGIIWKTEGGAGDDNVKCCKTSHTLPDMVWRIFIFFCIYSLIRCEGLDIVMPIDDHDLSGSMHDIERMIAL